MSKAKKTNPRRIPRTEADVERARKEGLQFGREAATVLFLTVLYDKEHADMEILQRVWGEINDLADSVIKGYVTIADLKNTLKEEYGVEV